MHAHLPEGGDDVAVGVAHDCQRQDQPQGEEEQHVGGVVQAPRLPVDGAAEEAVETVGLVVMQSIAGRRNLKAWGNVS